MKRIPSATSIAATAAALAIAWSPPTPGQAPGIGNYQLVSDVRVTRTVNELTYRAVLTNGAEALAGATAAVTSLAAATTIVDGTLTFGPVGPGGTVVSTDTFSFRQDRVAPFSWANLRWTITSRPSNRAPVARPGPSQTAPVGATITLDGSASSDVDGDPLGYQWALISRPAGSSAALANRTTIRPTFLIDRAGSYVAQLIVDDGTLSSAPATTTITTQNSPPVAAAGPDQSIVAGQLVPLSGAGSTDADGDPLTFEWSIVSRPSGSNAALADATSAGPSFTADRDGTYIIQLIVRDGGLSSMPDTVTITTRNVAPVAHAGPDQSHVPLGATIALDGSLSDDADHHPLTYSWSLLSKPAGSVATLGSPGSVRPTLVVDAAGDYTVQLVVNDGFVNSTPDMVVIRAVSSTVLPELSVDDVSVSEDEADLVFTITQSASSATTTRVNFATSNGTATSPEDFTAVSGTAEILPGSTTTEIHVSVRSDTLAEPDETVLLTLSNPVNATIADGEGAGEIVDDDPGPPTTFELIDAAVTDGAIDAETALVYKTFAEFQDPRLPAQYHGRDVAFFEGMAIREAARLFATLRPTTQAILAPFFEFPDLFALPVTQEAVEQASEEERRGPSARAAQASYSVLELVPGAVRMGWDANSPRAFLLELTAIALQAEFNARIWPKLRTFLGAPVAGNKILILLDDTTGPTFERSDCSIARIWLRHQDGVALTHELTHALLDLNFAISACNDNEKLWMHEATATWAQHYVYPPANTGREQGDAGYFLGAPERSLSAYDSSGPNEPGRGHQYGAYLWFLRLAGQENNPGVVRSIWQSAAGATSLEAIEDVLRGSGLGGFDDQWPKFALDNWNRQRPYRKYYDWDKLAYKASQHEFAANLNGAAWQNVQLGYDLPIVSADYQRWDFTKDPNIRGILFQNSNAGNTPTASIKMIVKIKDQPWREAEPEDLARTPEKFFCRDKAEEDVEEVILVVTNRGFRSSDPKIRDQGSFNLYYSALPCSDWTGSTTYRNESSPSPGSVSVLTAEGTDLRFHLDLTTSRALWRATEGIVTVRLNSTSPFDDGSCTSTAVWSFDANDRAQFVIGPLQGNAFTFLGSYLARPPTPPTIPETISCSSSSGSFTVTLDVLNTGTAWFNSGPTPLPFAVGSTTITGNYASTVGLAEERWTWSFVKVQ